MKISLYWKCQLIGWSAAAFYWTLNSLGSPEFDWRLAVMYFVGDLLIYIPLTHLYRNISLKLGWHKLQPGKLLLRIIPAILILGFLFLILTLGKNYLVRYSYAPELLNHSLNGQTLSTFMAGVRLMAIWILAYYGYHYAQREINAVKESSRLAVIAKEAEFNHLAAQLNPHFFFNSLNSIKALLTENPKAARRAIDLLSDLMRTSLYGRENRLIPLKEEMALVTDYLELEKIRFENRLDFSLKTDEHTAAIMVLPLSVQILVENAIKHGIAQSKEGGLVAVRTESDGDFLRVTVESPGTLATKSTEGLGLKNLRERLKLQFGERASFQIVQKSISLVSATVRIPLR